MGMKNKILAGFGAVALSVSFASVSQATLVLPGGEIALQTLLNDMTVGGDSSIDVNNDQYAPDAFWETNDSGEAPLNLLFEIAGNAGSNALYICDQSNIENCIQVFSGSDHPYDGGDFSFHTSIIIAGNGDVYLDALAPGNLAGTFSGNGFQFMLETNGGNFYSNPDDNGGDDHFVSFQGVGDVISVPFFGDKTWNSNGFIIGIEDLASGSWDQDYNDLVFMIESVQHRVPEPGILGLFGFGLLGMGVAARRRRKA